MANHPSALKRVRQSEKRRTRNRAVASTVRTAIKKLTTAISDEASEPIKNHLPGAISTLDRAGSKGVIPKKRASRKISRLTKSANAALAAASAPSS